MYWQISNVFGIHSNMWNIRIISAQTLEKGKAKLKSQGSYLLSRGGFEPTTFSILGWLLYKLSYWSSSVHWVHVHVHVNFVPVYMFLFLYKSVAYLVGCRAWFHVCSTSRKRPGITIPLLSQVRISIIHLSVYSLDIYAYSFVCMCTCTCTCTCMYTYMYILYACCAKQFLKWISKCMLHPVLCHMYTTI